MNPVNVADVIVQVPRPSWIATWGPVIGGSLTALAALAGVIITVGRARRSFLDERAENRRDRQRKVIADLIGVARQLNPLQSVLVFAWAKMDANDFVEWSATPSGTVLGELNQRRSDALLHARVEISDPPLRAAISAVREQINEIDRGEDAVTVMSTKRDGTRRLQAAVQQSVRMKELDRRLDELEDLAVQTLPVTIAHLSIIERLRRRCADAIAKPVADNNKAPSAVRPQ